MLKNFLTLRGLLILLSAGGVLLTAAILLTMLYFFQKENIEKSILNSNIAYAKKLADVTGRYFIISQRELAYSANQIRDFYSPTLLTQEANRLRLQSGLFNSVIVVNEKGVVEATSPESLSLEGVTLTSVANKIALSSHQPVISKPFVSAVGNYVVFISQPVFSADHTYLGYIGGTIYLKKQSILSDIIGQHFYTDQSEISIVSDDGDIIYNHNPALVGSQVTLSTDLKARLSSNESGDYFLATDKGNYLLGYASIRKTGWNIFIYGSTANVNQILYGTMKSVAWLILPVLLCLMALMTFFSDRIASPLKILAELMRLTDSQNALASIRKINTWYTEASRLQEAASHHILLMLNRMSNLETEAMIDPLTQLYNRRGFNMLVPETFRSFSQCIISVDIDYFKSINDKWGHDTGDTVLARMGGLLKETCRSSDIIGRFGGEEFVIFLPDTHIDKAAALAERIRLTVASSIFPKVGNITVSIGVTQSSEKLNDTDKTIKASDMALYEAKGAGRNIVVVNYKGQVKLYHSAVRMEK